ncbi:MFS transporter [Streptomyces sp. NPDC048057]|uniref:MFS transporter n=1 Tax=Streptomyces sp. NPDC048057 TaxID=3155628 RepID=UPI0033DB2D1D
MLLTPETTRTSEHVWSRDFTLFFVARTVSVLGDHMLIPTTMTVAMLQAGHGVNGVGYALASHTAPLALFVIYGGVLVDRFTPVRVMIVADVLRLVLHAALALAFATGDPPLWLVLGLLALSGVSTAAFQPGYASVIPQIASDVQKANGAIRVAESLMTVAGPATAGLLLAFASVPVVLAIDAATFAISAVCLLALRLKIPRSPRRTTIHRDLAEGWREFRARTWLWGVIVIWMFYQVTVNGPFLALGPSLITTWHGEGTLGLVLAMFGLGSVFGGLVAMRFKPVRPLRAGAVALLGTVFSLLAVALQLPPALIATGYVVQGAGAAFWIVMFHTSVQTKIPPDVLGRVHAYDVAGSLVMRPVGQVAVGPVSTGVGAEPVLFFSSAMLVVTVGLLLAVPAIRGLRRADAT